MLAQVIEALTALGIASGVTRSTSIYALVSASHVLGIALLIGPVLLADLRLAGLLKGLDERALHILRRTARLGILLVLLTGLLLISAKPAEYATNRIVWIKLIVVAAGLLNAILFEFRIRRNGIAVMIKAVPQKAALLSILLWLSALLLGRWIAFV